MMYLFLVLAVLIPAVVIYRIIADHRASSDDVPTPPSGGGPVAPGDTDRPRQRRKQQ